MKTIAMLPLIAILLFSCSTSEPAEEVKKKQATPLELLNRSLAPGINMGNALEAPSEGAWDVVIKDEYFSMFKEAGFSGVRIPIRWSAHTDTLPPYAINAEFLARVKYVVDLSLEQGLTTIINTHHYNPLFQAPDEHQERLLAMWRQIGEAFKAYPANLIFEPLNEPHAKLTLQLWNEWIPVLIKEIRSSNPERTLMLGTANWVRSSHFHG